MGSLLILLAHYANSLVRDMSNSSLEASYNLRKDEVLKAIREVHGKIGTLWTEPK